MLTDKSVNIICIYWEGDFRNRDFSVKDIERLHLNVDKFIDRPYKFYCLTNVEDVPAINIPLKHPEWPGWWAKVELHRPDLPTGRTLYLDLDTYIINSLQPVLDYNGNLVMFRNRAKIQNSVKKQVFKYQAAIMLFDPGSTSGFYRIFCEDPDYWMSKYRSEQDLMGLILPDQPTFPESWMIKMRKCLELSTQPKDVIFITGQPKNVSFRDPGIPWLLNKIIDE